MKGGAARCKTGAGWREIRVVARARRSDRIESRYGEEKKNGYRH